MFDLTEYPAVLTREQCDRIIKTFGASLARSSVLLAGERVVGHKSRTSWSATIRLEEFSEDIRAALLDRVAAICGLPVAHQEPWEIIRYELGESFDPHNDFVPDPDERGQRLYSALVCLGEPGAGGETIFPFAQRTVVPRQGTLAIWNNTVGARASNPLAMHAVIPVRAGVKWSLISWVRANPLI